MNPNQEMHYIQYFAEKYRVSSIEVNPVEFLNIDVYAAKYQLPAYQSRVISIQMDSSTLAGVAQQLYEADSESQLRKRFPALSDAYHKYQMLVQLYQGAV